MLSIYGLTYLVGCITFAVICYFRREQLLIPYSHCIHEQQGIYRWLCLEQSVVIIWICNVTILSGRLGYVLFYEAGYYLEHPWEIIQLYKGGMSFHGAVLGCIVATCWLTHNKLPSSICTRPPLNFTHAIRVKKSAQSPILLQRQRQAYTQVLSKDDVYSSRACDTKQQSIICRNTSWALTGWYFDCLSITALWLIPLGRFCNFLNGEAYGRVTEVPWGVIFLNVDLQVRHPSQLYESIAEGPVLAVILWLLAKCKKGWKFPGELALYFLAGYGVLRFGVEFTREADVTVGYLSNLTLGQILCLLQIIFSLVVLLQIHLKLSPRNINGQ